MADNLIEQCEEDGYKARRMGLPRLKHPISCAEGTPASVEKALVEAWQQGWDKADNAFTEPMG